MTGYGRATAEGDRTRVEISLRSVNHRFLDISVRLRDRYRYVEPALRRRIADRIERGHIEAAVEVTSLVEPISEVRLDGSIVRQVLRHLEELGPMLKEGSKLEVGDVLAIPEAWSVEHATGDWGGEDRTLLFECLDRAIDELAQARAQEGRSLFASLESTVEELDACVKELFAQRQAVQAGLVKRVQRRLAELLDTRELDPARLDQEVALLAEKSDVAEELDRLRGHLEHFAATLGNSEAVGRRLDFLAQEIARELNTLSVKCRDLEMGRTAIEGKLLCERLREQAQNVE